MEMAHFLAFLILLLTSHHWLRFVACSKRQGVVIIGTTIDPRLQRARGNVAPSCSEDYPFAFDTGQKCCKHLLKRNEQDQSIDCDGNEIDYYSSPTCCKGDDYIECKKPPCKNMIIRKFSIFRSFVIDLGCV